MANKRERERRESKGKVSQKDWGMGGGFESSSIKLPKGVESYKLEVGTHVIDIMPFVAGEGNPKADAGFEYFNRMYWVWKIPVPGGAVRYYCSLWDTFKKADPVREWIMGSGKGVDPDLIKALGPQSRVLFLINDKPKSTKECFKILDTIMFNRGLGFGEQLDELINSSKYGYTFSDLKGGCSLQIIVKEQTMGNGKKYNAVTRMDFLPRDYDYPEELLDKAPCLDDCLIETSYQELKRILGQDSSEDDNPETTNSESVVRHHTLEPEKSNNGETEKETPPTSWIKKGGRVSYKGKEWDVVKITSDGSGLTLEDDEGNTKRGVDSAMVRPSLEKPDYEAPKKEMSSATVKGSSVPDDDDDNNDEDEDSWEDA